MAACEGQTVASAAAVGDEPTSPSPSVPLSPTNTENDDGTQRSFSHRKLARKYSTNARNFRSSKLNKRNLVYRETLAEWFNGLFDLSYTEQSFMVDIATGAALCDLARACHSDKDHAFWRAGAAPTGIVPPPPPTRSAKLGSFFARDNIAGFIEWTRQLGLHESLRFETDDLVLRKNEKNVLNCLMEVARRSPHLRLLPQLVVFEQEIDGLADTPKVSVAETQQVVEAAEQIVDVVAVGGGKYRIGNEIFNARVFKTHIVVRVGGGWQPLQEYLYEQSHVKKLEALADAYAVEDKDQTGKVVEQALRSQAQGGDVSRVHVNVVTEQGGAGARTCASSSSARGVTMTPTKAIGKDTLLSSANKPQRTPAKVHSSPPGAARSHKSPRSERKPRPEADKAKTPTKAQGKQRAKPQGQTKGRQTRRSTSPEVAKIQAGAGAQQEQQEQEQQEARLDQLSQHQEKETSPATSPAPAQAVDEARASSPLPSPSPTPARSPRASRIPRLAGLATPTRGADSPPQTKASAAGKPTAGSKTLAPAAAAAAALTPSPRKGRGMAAGAQRCLAPSLQTRSQSLSPAAHRKGRLSSPRMAHTPDFSHRQGTAPNAHKKRAKPVVEVAWKW